MNRIIILFSILFTSLIFNQDKIFWDLGVIVKPKVQLNQNSIKPLIANTQIAPTYKINDFNLFDLTKTNLYPKQIIKLLYVKERYAELVEYVDNINTKSEENQLKDSEIFIYSDALYRLGKYNKALSNLNTLSTNYPLDQKYFVEALYNKKLGNIKQMNILLNKIMSVYPDSEYMKLAKLQYKISKK